MVLIISAIGMRGEKEGLAWFSNQKKHAYLKSKKPNETYGTIHSLRHNLPHTFSNFADLTFVINLSHGSRTD